MLPSPSATPAVSAPAWSDEEALEVATTVFKRYLEISNQIYNEGGAKPERIDVIASKIVAARDHAGFAEVSESTRTLLGKVELVKTTLQSRLLEPDETGSLAAVYACVDLRGTDVLDTTGVSIVSPDRPNTRTWEVGIGPGAAGQDEYIVTHKEVWSESAECE